MPGVTTYARNHLDREARNMARTFKRTLPAAIRSTATIAPAWTIRIHDKGAQLVAFVWDEYGPHEITQSL
jgi:hypothetical protein